MICLSFLTHEVVVSHGSKILGRGMLHGLKVSGSHIWCVYYMWVPVSRYVRIRQISHVGINHMIIVIYNF